MGDMGVLLAVYCHVYTRTCPAYEPAPLLLGAPIANVFPSDERLTDRPLWSPAASPSISKPNCVHDDPSHLYTRTCPAAEPLPSL